MSVCLPGRSQKVVCAGLLSVFAARSPGFAGSTVTASAGAFAGPAAGLAQTLAADAEGPWVGFGAASVVLFSQPVAASRASASGAAGQAQCRHLIPTRPSLP